MAKYDYITATGVIVPDTSTTRSDVEAEYRVALGADLNTDPSTPQGVLITQEVLNRDALVRNNAMLANQINPNFAGGLFLRSICELLGYKPPAARKSIVYGVVLSGNPGVTINAGSRIRTNDNAIFELISNVTLDAAGNGTGTFQATVSGAIIAPANSLTNIVDATIGWGSVTNPNPAIVGASELIDTDIRRQRKASIASNGNSTMLAAQARLEQISAVKSYSMRENIEPTGQTIDGVVLPGRSVWFCVDGGTDLEVATALLYSKSSGSGWTHGTNNGTPVTQSVTHTASGQVYPVKFVRQTDVPIAIKVTVSAGTSISEVTESVQTAIMNYAEGRQVGEPGFIVGASVSPFEISGAVARENSGVYIKRVDLTTVAANNFQPTEIPISLWQKATIAKANISVVTV